MEKRGGKERLLEWKRRKNGEYKLDVFNKGRRYDIIS